MENNKKMKKMKENQWKTNENQWKTSKKWGKWRKTNEKTMKTNGKQGKSEENEGKPIGNKEKKGKWRKTNGKWKENLSKPKNKKKIRTPIIPYGSIDLGQGRSKNHDATGVTVLIQWSNPSEDLAASDPPQFLCSNYYCIQTVGKYLKKTKEQRGYRV